MGRKHPETRHRALLPAEESWGKVSSIPAGDRVSSGSCYLQAVALSLPPGFCWWSLLLPQTVLALPSPCIFMSFLREASVAISSILIYKTQPVQLTQGSLCRLHALGSGNQENRPGGYLGITRALSIRCSQELSLLGRSGEPTAHELLVFL